MTRHPARGGALGAAAGALIVLSATVAPGAAERMDTAVLQGLDKVTARISTIQAPVGQVIRFGTLEIVVRACEKRSPEEAPESVAFVDIWEVREDQPAFAVYRGWMFASSPALAAMEHAVYDVWVVDCRNRVAAR